MSRSLTEPRPDKAPGTAHLTTFYREEFLKHRQCLQRQREYYSERAITDAEAALARILGRLEQLCLQENGEQVVSRLLRKFDSVTGLSGWTDLTKLH
jgi:hypothetical protein